MNYEKALSDAYERGYNAGLKDNGVNAVLGEVPSGSPCEICNKTIDNFNGNPDFWGVALPYQNGNGKMKYYHRGCVTNKIASHFT